jgi:hypothetical protein
MCGPEKKSTYRLRRNVLVKSWTCRLLSSIFLNATDQKNSPSMIPMVYVRDVTYKQPKLARFFDEEANRETAKGAKSAL